MTTDQHIGTAEAAERLGVSRSTFQRWVDADKIAPAFRGQGRGPRGIQLFDPADVEKLRQSRVAELEAELALLSPETETAS